MSQSPWFRLLSLAGLLTVLGFTLSGSSQFLRAKSEGNADKEKSKAKQAKIVELAFDNTRFTYGAFGQSRKVDVFLPGDVVYLSFDVQGLKVNDSGQALYSMGMEVARKGQKQAIQKRAPRDLKEEIKHKKGTLETFVWWPIPRDGTAPGEYTLKITVTDRQTMQTATLSKKFEVAPISFGIVGVHLTTEKGKPIAPKVTAGQTVALNYALVGFKLDNKNNTNVTISIRTLDGEGKPTKFKPFTGEFKVDEVSARGLMRPTPYLLGLNRAGKFKVVLAAKCNVSGKSAKEVLDLTVLDGK
jgi:hypothetical protein